MTSITPLSPSSSIRSINGTSPAFYVSAQLADDGVQAYLDGDFDKALKSLTTALKTQQLTLGNDDLVVAHTLGNIGAVYIAMGALIEAMQALQQCLDIKMKLRSDLNLKLPDGIEAVTLADTLSNLGGASFLRGEYIDAMSYYQSCLKELTEGPIPGSKVEIANVLYNIGNVHCLRNELDDALVAMLESLQLSQAAVTEGADASLLPEVLEKIGAIYMNQQRFDDAMNVFLEALTITKTTLGSDHVDCGVSAYNVGMVYEYKGEIGLATQSYNVALDIFQNNGINNTSTDMIRQRLTETQMNQRLVY